MSPNLTPTLKDFKQFDSLWQGIDSPGVSTKRSRIDPDDIRHGFKVGDYSLLVPKGVRTEVIDADTIYPLPNMPDWFRGFANHRGEARPVYYLDALLNPQTPRKKNRQWILFLGQQQKSCGILLNHCPHKVSNLTEKDLMAASSIPECIALHVEKAFFDGQHEWLDFSYHPFFLSLKSAF